MKEDKVVGWHHQLNEHEFEQTPGVGEGHGSLVCYSPWGPKESDTTEQLNNNTLIFSNHHPHQSTDINIQTRLSNNKKMTIN